MDKLDLTIRGDVERLHVEPNDVVIVRIHGAARLSDEASYAAKRTIERALQQVGLDNPVLVVDAEAVTIEVAGP